MKTRAKRFVSALLAGVLCLSLLAGCASKKKELTRYSTVFYDVFDTVTQVIAYCESEEEFNTQMDALHADLITYNQLYDIYNDYPGVTNVKTINDNAGSAPVEVDDRILSMLDGAINMSDMALVTSGDYQRYYVVDGKRYHHLIDPDTLFPAAYFNGVTVLCSDSGLADCLTTGLFCQPLEDGMKIVESLDGVEAMWCTPDQQVITSSGWDSHLKK